MSKLLAFFKKPLVSHVLAAVVGFATQYLPFLQSLLHK